MNLPIFIEALSPQDQEKCGVCDKVRARLAAHGLAPLPYATTLDEVAAMLQAIKAAGHTPAIFVLNTLNARQLISSLDPLMGETPALYFRRTLQAGQSGLNEYLLPEPEKAETMRLLGKLTLRLTSVWYYGSKNLDTIADQAALALARFLKDREFRMIEAANKFGQVGPRA